ncbi:hypothetical protein RCG23_05375 [Neobacillus sp. PS3-34]|uniref:hypothetical protein n=1 Tax=Neobacillus sp. PS3-34 TaxID=3070678 RepID=UPI0027E05334|nr:hypothetical protein [Neobacillus sp. PS3-34]WML49444.1 hypothetical protein RCG23_05375 [Neobacillus sp. PS3-34]
MYNPHYRDFYQKPLIPIGLKDKLALMEAEFAPPAAARSTHWLIAFRRPACISWRRVFPLEGQHLSF